MSDTEVVADTVDVPAGPAISGLVFRRFRRPGDFPGMVEANMAVRDAHGVEDTISVEGMATQYAHLRNSDVSTDLVIIELDGRTVGYVRVAWNGQHDGSVAYESICLLRPELRGRGIGRAMLRWGERRLREIGATQPADGRPRWFQAETFDADAYSIRLLERHGYTAVRRGYEMVRPDLADIDDVPLPRGLEVRPVGPEKSRQVWEADAEAFRDHWGEDEETEEAWLAFREDPTHDPALWVVAFDGDEIAGLVLNVIDPADVARKGTRGGNLSSVAVRRPWRRRGLARALIARSLRLVRDRGATSAVLGVDGANPNQAMTLYEQCGFRVVSSFTTWRKPFTEDDPEP